MFAILNNSILDKILWITSTQINLCTTEDEQRWHLLKKINKTESCQSTSFMPELPNNDMEYLQ